MLHGLVCPGVEIASLGLAVGVGSAVSGSGVERLVDPETVTARHVDCDIFAVPTLWQCACVGCHVDGCPVVDERRMGDFSRRQCRCRGEMDSGRVEDPGGGREGERRIVDIASLENRTGRHGCRTAASKPKGVAVLRTNASEKKKKKIIAMSGFIQRGHSDTNNRINFSGGRARLPQPIPGASRVIVGRSCVSIVSYTTARGARGVRLTSKRESNAWNGTRTAIFFVCPRLLPASAAHSATSRTMIERFAGLGSELACSPCSAHLRSEHFPN